MRLFTSVYLLLLGYVITALVFWELALQRQSGRIFSQEVITLKSSIDSVADPQAYNAEYAMLKKNLNTRTFQYVGEGTTFMVVILIGAFVVYRSIRRSINLSRQQNNFMLSVTHELKSPIAAVKLNLQTLERRQLEPVQKQSLIDRCLKEADRLNDLCNNILVTSQIEGGSYKRPGEIVNISEIAEEAVDEYGNRYPQRITEDIEPSLKVVGDRLMLRMVINNLLENAIKYSPADKPVTVELREGSDFVRLSVIDYGPGIPEGEKKMVFNKFYRVGNEESRRSKGTGLGLYLVRRIIQQHKGHIGIKDNQPNGSVFVIQLPIYKK